MQTIINTIISDIRDKISEKIPNKLELNYNLKPVIKGDITFVYNKKVKEISGRLNAYNLFDIDLEDIHITIIYNDIDINEILAVIRHELTHVWDFYNLNINHDIKDSLETDLKLKQISEFATPYFKYFLYLIYLAHLHELNANSSMVYDRLRNYRMMDVDYLMEEFHKTEMYKTVKMLDDFDAESYVNDCPLLQKSFMINNMKNFLAIYLNKDYNVDSNNIVSVFKIFEPTFKRTYNQYMTDISGYVKKYVLDFTKYNEMHTFRDNRWNGRFEKFDIDVFIQYLIIDTEKLF